MTDRAVTLTLPADIGFAGVARSTTTRLAAVSGLSVERIEDVRLAVSEVFTALTALSSPALDVTIAFVAVGPEEAEFAIELSIPRVVALSDLGDSHDMAWALAGALVDAADWRVLSEGTTVFLAIQKPSPSAQV